MAGRRPSIFVATTLAASSDGWVDERIDVWGLDGRHLASAQQLRVVGDEDRDGLARLARPEAQRPVRRCVVGALGGGGVERTVDGGDAARRVADALHRRLHAPVALAYGQLGRAELDGGHVVVDDGTDALAVPDGAVGRLREVDEESLVGLDDEVAEDDYAEGRGKDVR